MPGPFDAAGAERIASGYAPLAMDRYITGLVTNRSPLRDAAVPYLYAKFYQAGRFDSLIDGLNVELTSKLTLARRPGHSVYNAQNFPPVLRYYPFRVQIDGQASVRLMVDTAAAVYDGTGPNTKTAIWNKSAGAGKTCFQSVGNTLYFSDGVENLKWVVSTKSYKSGATYNAGDFINDPNGNIQVAFGARQAAVTASVAISGPHPPGGSAPLTRVELTLDRADPFVDKEEVSFQGLTLAAMLNGLTLPAVASLGAILIQTDGTLSAFSGADTGVVYTAGGTGSGVTGAAAPAWATAPGSVTVDGGVIWVCKGSAVQKWGTAAPTSAPIISQTVAQSAYGPWAAATYYSPNGMLYDTANGAIAQLITGGVTGTSAPVLSTAVGATTADGSAVWQTVNGGWSANTAVSAGAVVLCSLNTGIAYVMFAFRCTAGGITAASVPYWQTVFGSQASDGTAVWENIGPVVEWSAIGASTNISTAQTILDPNGYLQAIEVAGISGAASPASWAQIVTQLTVDNQATWVNTGAYAPAGTAATSYAYSFKASVTDTESSLSPIASYTRRADHSGFIQGYGSADPQVDTIVIYRTVEGGSSLLYDSEIPAPAGGASALWSFLDTAADTALDIEIQGAINSVNAPPPAGLDALSYHMGRIWGGVGPLLYWCSGPDAPVGNGLEAWAPGNAMNMAATVNRTVPWDLPDGVLLVFTSAGPQAVWGQGTSTDPFYPKTFTQGAGLLSYDELTIAEGWIHQLTSDRRLLSFQPTSGYGVNGSTNDSGAPIGDQFLKVTTGGYAAAIYTPGNSFVSYHANGTNDVGLFVADGSTGWFRFSQVTEPESGFVWSPFAAVAGGTSAVASVETSPGLKSLLVGPAVAGPILQRDGSLNADNGTAFAGYATIGSVQLCAPTEIAEVAAIILDSIRVGTSPGVAILLGEIAATIKKPFVVLEQTGFDPANLPPSTTLFNSYFSVEQNGQTNQCRHMQIMIQLATEDAPSEILGHAVYGRQIPQRRQE